MNYDQLFVREGSLIFFIRNKQEPTIPFVTVEHSTSQKKVLQCCGEHDPDILRSKQNTIALRQQTNKTNCRIGKKAMANYFRITAYHPNENF